MQLDGYEALDKLLRNYGKADVGPLQALATAMARPMSAHYRRWPRQMMY